MMVRRVWAKLPLLVLLPFWLSACGGGGASMPDGAQAPAVTSPAAPTDPAATDEPTAAPTGGVTAEPMDDKGCTAADPCQLTFRWWGGEARAELQRQAIAAFEQAHPGIKITPESIPTTELDRYFDNLSIEMAAGSEPDIFTLGGAWPLDYGRAGTLLPLSDNPNIDITPFNPNILVDATVQGQVFGVPTGGNATGLVVNPRIFDQAGVPLPDDGTWTWDEFVTIANQITAQTPDGTYGVEMRPQDMLGSFAAQRDGSGFFNQDGELIVPAATLEAYFQMILDLQAGGGMPPAEMSTQLALVGPEETLMGRGLGAMLFAPSNEIVALAQSSGDELMILRIPGETQFQSAGVAVVPSQWLVVGANTEHPAAAARFVDWMVNSIDAAQIMRVDRGDPLNAQVAAAIEPLLDPVQQHQVDYLARISQYAGPIMPQPPGSGEQPNISVSTQEALLFGHMTPAQAATSWLTRMRTELAAAQ